MTNYGFPSSLRYDATDGRGYFIIYYRSIIMGFVRTFKRRFRVSCIIIAFFGICFLVGCGSKLTTHAYPLGRYPKVTERIVSEIAGDEVRKHRHTEQKQGRFILEMFDDHVVVKTTAEGHRQIKADLKRLEGEPTGAGED